MRTKIGIGIGIGFNGPGGGDSLSGFLPSDLSGLVAWYKADGSVYNTGTTQATNGQTVATWVDSSPSAKNVVQASAGNKPTFVTNQVNGKAVLLFDGVDDELAASGFSNNFARHVFVVLKINTATCPVLGGVVAVTDSGVGNVSIR